MKAALALLVFLTFPHLLQEQIAPDLHPASFGALTFYFENDAFGGTDQDYTKGARIRWTSPSLMRFSEAPTAGSIAGIFDDGTGDSSYTRNVAVSIGQSLNTPPT